MLNLHLFHKKVGFGFCFPLSTLKFKPFAWYIIQTYLLLLVFYSVLACICCSIQKKELLLEDLSCQLKAKELQIDNLTSEVNSYKTEITEQQRVVQLLREEVNKHQLETERLTSDLTQQKSQITKLIKELDSQQLKNNVSLIYVMYNLCFYYFSG